MTSDPPVFNITFLRHGESIGNLENRLQGHSDYPLSDTGRLQARALGERWLAESVGFDTIITSPLSRARETAEIIQAALGVPVLEEDSLWLERDMGARAGMTVDEIRANFSDPDFVNPYSAVGDGAEGDWALYLRAGQALHKLLQRPQGRYLIVSHGAIMNMTLMAVLGIAPQPYMQGPRFRLGNTAFATFRYFPEKHRWWVDVIGDRSHWKD